MKINWLENPIKTNFSCNLYAMVGLYYFVFYLYLLVSLFTTSSDGGGGVIFAILIVATYQVVISVLCVGLLVIELLFKHRMENKFVRENKIYNALFYLGFVFNTIAILLIAYLYKIPIQEYFSLLF